MGSVYEDEVHAKTLLGLAEDQTKGHADRHLFPSRSQPETPDGHKAISGGGLQSAV